MSPWYHYPNPTLLWPWRWQELFLSKLWPLLNLYIWKETCEILNYFHTAVRNSSCMYLLNLFCSVAYTNSWILLSVSYYYQTFLNNKLESETRIGNWQWKFYNHIKNINGIKSALLINICHRKSILSISVLFLHPCTHTWTHTVSSCSSNTAWQAQLMFLRNWFLSPWPPHREELWEDGSEMPVWSLSASAVSENQTWWSDPIRASVKSGQLSEFDAPHV